MIAVAADQDSSPRHDADHTWPKFVNHIVRVSQDDVHSAVNAVFTDAGVVLEPPGVRTVAGVMRYVQGKQLLHQRIVAVVDTPLRTLESLQPVVNRIRRLDGSHFVLAVRATHKKPLALS